MIVSISLWVEAMSLPSVMKKLYVGVSFVIDGIVVIICNQNYKK